MGGKKVIERIKVKVFKPVNGLEICNVLYLVLASIVFLGEDIYLHEKTFSYTILMFSSSLLLKGFSIEGISPWRIVLKIAYIVHSFSLIILGALDFVSIIKFVTQNNLIALEIGNKVIGEAFKIPIFKLFLYILLCVMLEIIEIISRDNNDLENKKGETS